MMKKQLDAVKLKVRNGSTLLIHVDVPPIHDMLRLTIHQTWIAQAAFGSVGGTERDASGCSIREPSIRSRRMPIPSPQRLESKTKPHVSGVKMVIGLRSIRLEDVPNKGKNGTSIYMTSFSYYKNAAFINEEATDEKSLYTV